jgi:hypothetical protein
MEANNPTYTFLSVFKAKPGRLEDLIQISKTPSETMDEAIEGVIARQVSVDHKRNTVAVWATFDKKETLYDYLKTTQGKEDHGIKEDMSCIESFEMYDLTPITGRILPKS